MNMIFACIETLKSFTAFNWLTFIVAVIFCYYFLNYYYKFRYNRIIYCLLAIFFVFLTCIGVSWLLIWYYKTTSIVYIPGIFFLAFCLFRLYREIRETFAFTFTSKGNFYINYEIEKGQDIVFVFGFKKCVFNLLDKITYDGKLYFVFTDYPYHYCTHIDDATIFLINEDNADTKYETILIKDEKLLKEIFEEYLARNYH